MFVLSAAPCTLPISNVLPATSSNGSSLTHPRPVLPRGQLSKRTGLRDWAITQGSSPGLLPSKWAVHQAICSVFCSALLSGKVPPLQAILRTQDLLAELKDASLTLTPEAGLAVQPSSAVAVLVSISVSENQKERRIGIRRWSDSDLHFHEILLDSIWCREKSWAPSHPSLGTPKREKVC